MEKEIKWLIVQGCPRSGTTILTRLLNSHPLIYLTYEYNLAKPFFKNYYKIIPKKKRNRIIYLGDKLPQYFFYHKRLKKRLKNFKIIHISRNPLFVASSFKRLRLNPFLDPRWNRFLTTKDAICLWISAWNKINEIKDDLNVFHLKYEDLVKNPEKELEKIAKFLAIENCFDLSLVSKEEKPIILEKKELNLINKYLKDIINDWNLPLNDLEKKYPKIKNFSFPKTRIILKDLIFDYFSIK